MTGDLRPKIKIVQTPLGEAPEWVRESWIGVTIPLVLDEPGVFQGFGVLSGPKTRLGDWWWGVTRRYGPIEGYQVYAAEAVELLGFSKPLAAQWWRQDASHLLRPGQTFIFDTGSCRKL